MQFDELQNVKEWPLDCQTDGSDGAQHSMHHLQHHPPVPSKVQSHTQMRGTKRIKHKKGEEEEEEEELSILVYN